MARLISLARRSVSSSVDGGRGPRLSGAGCRSGGGLRLPRLLGELGKRGGAGDGEFGQALAIERHARVLQPADERAVRQAVLACRRVDADDPQPPEVALLAAAADKRVLERGVDRLFRSAIQLALVGVVALRQAEQFLALGAANGSSFYTRHVRTSPICTEACARASPRPRLPPSSTRGDDASASSSCCSGCAA